MHVPDGFLSPKLTLPAYALAVPLWVAGVRRHFGPSSLERLPLVGALTALAFVIQTLVIPLPGGTSVHLVGCALVAFAFGPLVAFVCEGLVLAVQALVFGVGGLTVLAVNALAMGLVGPVVGWLVWKALARIGGRPAAFAGAYVAVQVSTAAVALVLGLQHALSPAYFPVPLEVTAAAMMIPSLVTGLVEGAYTVLALGLVSRVRARDAG